MRLLTKLPYSHGPAKPSRNDLWLKIGDDSTEIEFRPRLFVKDLLVHFDRETAVPDELMHIPDIQNRVHSGSLTEPLPTRGFQDRLIIGL
jgi:hypothetical protein